MRYSTMRYSITLSTGEVYYTDFEDGEPIRKPNGAESLGRKGVLGAWPTIIVRRMSTNGQSSWPISDPFPLAVNPPHIVSIIDLDCG